MSRTVLRVVCGADHGRCRRNIASVDLVDRELLLVPAVSWRIGAKYGFGPEDFMVTALTDGQPGRLARLAGDAPLFGCPRHARQVQTFPLALLQEPLARWRATGDEQAVEWSPRVGRTPV